MTKNTKRAIPMDDKYHSSTLIYYDIFYFGERFIHRQLTENNDVVTIKGHVFSYKEGNLSYSHEQIEDLPFVLLPHERMTTIVTNKPKKGFILSAAKASAIYLETTAMILVTVVEETGEYMVTIDSGSDAVYYNDRLIEHGRFSFGIGDQLIVNRLMLEVRERQMKLTSFGKSFSLDHWQLVEEEFQPEYPIDFPLFRRSPRIQLVEPTTQVELFAPKEKPIENKTDLFQQIFPMLGMLMIGSIFSFIGGIQPLMLLSMGGAMLGMLGFSLVNNTAKKKERTLQWEKYAKHNNEQLLQTKSLLNQLIKEQRTVLEYRHPSMDSLVLMVKEYHPRIYEKMPLDADFLTIRIGRGEVPASFKIKEEARREDEHTQINEQLIRPYLVLQEAPIELSLKGQTLGLAGALATLRVAIQNLLFQVSVFHSYHEIKFVLLLPEEGNQKEWAAWRWLPHIKNRCLQTRGMIDDEASCKRLLPIFYQVITKRRQQVQKNGEQDFRPVYLFVILEERWLSGHALNEWLAEDLSRYGVIVVWGKEKTTMLPETITTLMVYQHNQAAWLINKNRVYINQFFVPDQLSTTDSLEQGIKRLANLRHIESAKNTLPETLSLFELYGVKCVEELAITTRWSNADPSQTLRVLIGWRGVEDAVYWDLHERAHGPHALIGGTTGSGKSEFLMTYLIGLAIHFSPEDVGILVIDWKGGGLADSLAELPHFMGAITNLSGVQTARALLSIKSELKKRQRMFAKYGVDHLSGYMRLYKQRQEADSNLPTEPLPHLFLVSDEFAELKANIPEFLEELTSVARIGRSLGLHLILATQKPSGIVNDQIEANSTSRIALKMANDQDSNEVLRTTDAAHLTNSGRGYLKVGQNEVYELFQSGYVRAPYHPEEKTESKREERIYQINRLGQAELLYDPDPITQPDDMNEPISQLEAVRQVIRQVVETAPFIFPERPWLPELSKQLPSPSKKRADTSGIPLGLLDLPEAQTQKTYYYELEKAGHTMIAASPGYGKSVFLQTIILNMARDYTPEQLQFHLLDFGNNGLSAMKELPHVSDLVYVEEKEKLSKMMNRIKETLMKRKDLLKKLGVTNVGQYERKTKQRLPRIVTVLDNYEGIEGRKKEQLDEGLLQLMRDGRGLGCYLLLSANDPNSIRLSMLNHFSTRIALYLNNESEVKHFLGKDSLTPQSISGRGQILLDVPTAIQIYLPVPGKNEIEQLINLEAAVKEIDRSWTGNRPGKIPMVPERLTSEVFYQQVAARKKNCLYLGLNKETAVVEQFMLFEGQVLGIFTESSQQSRKLLPWFFRQIQDEHLMIHDPLGALEFLKMNETKSCRRSFIQSSIGEKIERPQLRKSESIKQTIFVITGEWIEQNYRTWAEAFACLPHSTKEQQVILIDSISKVGASYQGITTAIKEYSDQILFGGCLDQQLFIEGFSYEERNERVNKNVLYLLKEEQLAQVVIPLEDF